MAGQSVGLVDRIQPLRGILADLIAEADAALRAALDRAAGVPPRE